MDSDEDLVCTLALLLSGDAAYDARLIAYFCHDYPHLDPDTIIFALHDACTWPINESVH
jgi:hypothetical protein